MLTAAGICRFRTAGPNHRASNDGLPVDAGNY
jgi:hypothetical protein